MKKITLTISLVLAFTFAKTQQIPNGSFENWTLSGTQYTLDSYVDINFFTASYPTYGTLRTTDAMDGTYALELKSNRFDLTPGGFPIIDTAALVILGYATTSSPPAGIPFAFRPIKLSFYYKYLPGTIPVGVIDTARVFVDFQKHGIGKVGRGYFNIYGNAVTTYTYHEITINWFTDDIPDTLRMDLTSGLVPINYNANGGNPCNNQIGNTLFLDKMVFKYATGINEYETTSDLNIFPNPASNIITLNIYDESNTDLTLNIYNVMGSLVKAETLNQNQQQINVANLSNGIYIVEIKSNNFTGKQKLLIQK